MAKPASGTLRQPRTLLEAKIRERRQTYEEFVEFAERFARDHGEVGTLSVRHLQRLAAGRRSKDRPLGPVQLPTARLLERIFSLPITELLGPPTSVRTEDCGAELRLRLVTARRLDRPTLDLLASQLEAIRQIDRRLGAVAIYRDVVAKAEQIATLLAHSLTPGTRARLAELLADAWSLAGWAALDLGDFTGSWQHHEQAKVAAREAGCPALLAYATAQQAVILIDLGETDAAVDQLGLARAAAAAVSPVFGAWLAAAHGGGLAAAGRQADSLRAFDVADSQLRCDTTEPSLPFVFLGGAHLTRWRGHAMATLGDPEAPAVLNCALRRLDPTFTRAEVGVRTDLAIALTAQGQHDEALHHLSQAQRLAIEIGSSRQLTRLRALAVT